MFTLPFDYLASPAATPSGSPTFSRISFSTLHRAYCPQVRSENQFGCLQLQTTSIPFSVSRDGLGPSGLRACILCDYICEPSLAFGGVGWRSRPTSLCVRCASDGSRCRVAHRLLCRRASVSCSDLQLEFAQEITRAPAHLCMPACATLISTHARPPPPHHESRIS
jgi:hypothetical protein